jgi:hypothetical protein
MATKIRGRVAAYDNIAKGDATGAERTIRGDSVSKVEMHGGGFRTSTSTGDEWHSNLVAGTSVSNDAADGTVAGGAVPENMHNGTTGTVERTGSSNVAGFVTNA